MLPEDGLKRKHSEEDKARERLGRFTNHAPSSLAEGTTFQKAIRTGVVRLNRPFEFHSIPIALLQKEFGEFRDDCEAAPSVQAQKLSRQLTVAACEWHENESARVRMVYDIFTEYAELYLAPGKIPGTAYSTDGNLLAHIVPPAIRECRLETGCALFEAIGYYANYLRYKIDVSGTCFPCVLMLDVGKSAFFLSPETISYQRVGSSLAFYGCLWTGTQIFVEPLIPSYDLTTHSAEEAGRRAIASSLSAFMNITKRLETHYASVPDLPLRDPSYPYPTSYNDKDGRQINFKYERRVEEKLIFMVMTDTDERAVAKFTRRYSADAHTFLASLGHAPSLRAVTPLPGGWILVVMDLSPFPLLSELNLSDKLREQVRLKITNIVRTLHENRFVHGDIRSVNILVEYEALARGEDFGIHLLDFDWAGWIGEAKYPTRVNTETVRRPEGVADGEYITCDHDVGMVNLLW